MTDHERLLGPNEIAAWMRARNRRVSATTIRRALRSGAIPGRKLGERFVTSEAELRAWFGIQSDAVIAADAPPAVPNVTEFLARRKSA